MMIRRSLEEAVKWALRLLRREELTAISKTRVSHLLVVCVKGEGENIYA